MAEREAAAAAVTIDTIGARLRGQLTALKRPIMAVVQKFQAGREAAKEIAPKVIGLFNSIKADHAAFTFVEFCRMIDPSVPTGAGGRDGIGGYRQHPTYYTLDYMRRQLTQRPRGRQGVRDSATDALARAIATVLQVAEDAAPVWAAIQTEFQFNERVMGRLRKRVEATKPLFAINVPRGAHVRVGNVIHMDRVQVEEAQGDDAMRQPGRRVKRAAA